MVFRAKNQQKEFVSASIVEKKIKQLSEKSALCNVCINDQAQSAKKNASQC